MKNLKLFFLNVSRFKKGYCHDCLTLSTDIKLDNPLALTEVCACMFTEDFNLREYLLCDDFYNEDENISCRCNSDIKRIQDKMNHCLDGECCRFCKAAGFGDNEENDTNGDITKPIEIGDSDQEPDQEPIKKRPKLN